MKLAVIGNKEFTDYGWFCSELDKIGDISQIISGAAAGTDTMAKLYAGENLIGFLEFPPQFDLHGSEAKHIRDRQIVDNCDKVLAFWDGNCEGTSYTINYALELTKPVQIIRIKL